MLACLANRSIHLVAIDSSLPEGRDGGSADKGCVGSRHQTADKYAEADKRDWLLSDRRQWAYPFVYFR